MHRALRCFLLVALAHVFSSSLSRALPAVTRTPGDFPSDPGSLFQPDDFVPLSDFLVKEAGVPLTLHVKTDILEFIDDKPSEDLYVCVSDGSSLSYFEVLETHRDPTNGTVTFDHATIEGSCVVVSDHLLHHLLIETHWTFSTEDDRGKYCPSGQDGFKRIDFDPSTDTTSVTHDDVDLTDPASAYYYNSHQYNVFSDGTTGNDSASVRTPAYERYVGENYCLARITPMAAIWLSDHVREATGFPVAHRNARRAFELPWSPTLTVDDGLPVFQLAHAHEVVVDYYPTSNEHSLATFVLPPHWTRVTDYPVLFNGYYDLHESLYEPAVGLEMFETLGALHAEERLVVGILWNGGAAMAGATFNRSAYANANQLFQDAKCLVKADIERMVFTGISRGGTTALALASNPYEYPYTARFVHARAPFVRFGTIAKTFMNATHAHMNRSIERMTGYDDSWQSCWSKPNPVQIVRGRPLALKNLFGTNDPGDVDTLFSIHSALFRQHLKCEKTEVVLRFGTHDEFGSSALLADYVNQLRAEGVSLLCDVFYRFGHAVPADNAPDDAELLRKLWDCEPLPDPCDPPCAGPCPDDPDPCLEQETRFYATNPTTPEGYELIDSGHVPLAFEAPLVAGPIASCLQPYPFQAPLQTWSFFGEPDTVVRVYVSSSPFPDPPEEDVPFYTCTLTGSGDLGYHWTRVTAPELEKWFYRVDYLPPEHTEFIPAPDVCPTDATPLYLAGPFITILPMENLGLPWSGRTGGVASDVSSQDP